MKKISLTVILALFGLLLLNPAFAQARPEGECSQKKAVVLVGGMYNDWRYFEPWLQDIRSPSVCVFGFAYSHSKMTMTQGAELLETDLRTLREAGVEEVVILAHSMGGLVVSKALHNYAADPLFPLTRFKFHAYGTPWGGFFWSNFVRWTPGMNALLTKLGVPMGNEIGSWSPFIESLKEPLPGNVQVVLHNSASDEIAQPQTVAAKAHFEAAIEHASEVHTYADIGHSDFVERLRYTRP